MKRKNERNGRQYNARGVSPHILDWSQTKVFLSSTNGLHIANVEYICTQNLVTME